MNQDSFLVAGELYCEKGFSYMTEAISASSRFAFILNEKICTYLFAFNCTMWFAMICVSFSVECGDLCNEGGCKHW